MYEELEHAGFTSKEITVYVALLQTGTCSIGAIREATGMQHSVVHLILERLTHKGAVSYLYEGKKRIFHANQPTCFLDRMEQQRKEVQGVVRKLQKLQNEENKPVVTLHRGARSVRQLWRRVLEENVTAYCAYGGSKTSHTLLGDFFWKRLYEEQKNTGVRMIFHRSLAWRGRELAKRKNTSIRYTDEHFEELSEVLIFNDTVITFMYLDEPYATVLESKSAARSQKKFFESLWKAAEK